MANNKDIQGIVHDIFNIMFDAYGEQFWWPGETDIEIAIGAILTQNTSWTNVEKVIHHLKNHGLVNEKRLYQLPDEKMAEFLRPSGYFNIKTKRLKNFLRVIVDKYDADIKNLFKNKDVKRIRHELLSINGIGPETADCILLYAGRFPVFVVDRYTLRIFSRHKLVSSDSSYKQLQDFFMAHLEHNEQLFNEYHALIVKTGKLFCGADAKCDSCPLKDINR